MGKAAKTWAKNAKKSQEALIAIFNKDTSISTNSSANFVEFKSDSIHHAALAPHVIPPVVFKSPPHKTPNINTFETLKKLYEDMINSTNINITEFFKAFMRLLPWGTTTVFSNCFSHGEHQKSKFVSGLPETMKGKKIIRTFTHDIYQDLLVTKCFDDGRTVHVLAASILLVHFHDLSARRSVHSEASNVYYALVAEWNNHTSNSSSSNDPPHENLCPTHRVVHPSMKPNIVHQLPPPPPAAPVAPAYLAKKVISFSSSDTKMKTKSIAEIEEEENNSVNILTLQYQKIILLVQDKVNEAKSRLKDEEKERKIKITMERLREEKKRKAEKLEQKEETEETAILLKKEELPQCVPIAVLSEQHSNCSERTIAVLSEHSEEEISKSSNKNIKNRKKKIKKNATKAASQASEASSVPAAALQATASANDIVAASEAPAVTVTAPEAPAVIVMSSPDEAPDDTPDVAAVSSPDEAPDVTAASSPDEALDDAPDVTAASSPDEALDEAPDDAPDVTAASSPDEAPDESPDDAPDVAAASSLDEEPNDVSASSSDEVSDESASSSDEASDDASDDALDVAAALSADDIPAAATASFTAASSSASARTVPCSSNLEKLFSSCNSLLDDKNNIKKNAEDEDEKYEGHQNWEDEDEDEKYEGRQDWNDAYDEHDYDDEIDYNANEYKRK